ncbi:MAG: hypothetical protein IJC75_03730 [Oscillospiraceae bacterium]|nr:hypothetical protein [Ruminococcus sp.]MBQ4346227.1 hypothetical protein [Oscillospiraceae bacterium]
MELSLNKETLADPKKRLLIGVLTIIICLVAIHISGLYAGVTKESCMEIQGKFEECKSRSSQTSTGDVSYYLMLEEQGSDYAIHASCEDGVLIEDLLKLRAGAPVRLLVDEPTGTVYEIEVRGEMWLSFEDAQKQIGGNMKLIKYMVYIFMAVGAVCVVTAVGAFLFRKKETDVPEPVETQAENHDSASM